MSTVSSGDAAAPAVARAPGAVPGRTERRPIITATIGNTMEWYDFAVYAYFATTISDVFFPGDAAGLLLTFATFGVGFLMRPLGALAWGHVGDRHGRRAALTGTIVLMAGATFCIGLIPSYATIGIWAPLALLVFRLAQGFAAGGEWGGSTSFMVEHAAGRRGLIGSWQQFGVITALLLGTGTGALISGVLSESQLQDWGWRIPFLAGVLVGLVGLYLRTRVQETPKFVELERADAVTAAPLKEILVEHRASILRAAGLTVAWTVTFYISLTYLPTYLKKEHDFSTSHALVVTSIGLAFLAALIPPLGHLSDRIGRRPLMLAGCAVSAVITVPLFAVLGTSDAATIAAMLALVVPVALMSGPGPAMLAELFPTRVRYTALSLPYNVSVAIFGGFAPFIATGLIDLTGSRLTPTIYVVLASLVSLATIATMRETAHEPLR